MIRVTVFALLVIAAGLAYCAGPTLIPQPKSATCTHDDFVIRPRARVVIPKGASQDVKLAAVALARALEETAGHKVPVTSGNTKREISGSFLLRTGLTDPALGREGYRLTVGNGVVLEAVGAGACTMARRRYGSW